jgi:Flp pilus assembly protein TadG
MKQILTGQRGVVLILVALSLFVLLGFAAFAIDFGYAYVVRNQLQNAADASALAGASVLFRSNENCLSGASPYSCCTGSGIGSCDPSKIENANVTGTAQAVAALNNNSTNPDPVLTVEIGHYAFSSSQGTPGTFTAAPAASTYTQMTDWQTLSFSVLNDSPNFINAVRVTVSRTDVPRFFSRIWGSSDLAITAQAVAYIGFSASLVPGEVDQPIAICEAAIKDGNHYTCNVGTMLNNNTQTARWTNFDQTTCKTAVPPDVSKLICGGGNPQSIKFGEGIGTTNGTQGLEVTSIYDCWKASAKYDSDGDGVPDQLLDTDGDGVPDRPWKITLPVVDCSETSSPYSQTCLKVVGAVEVNVVWINDKNSADLSKANAWYPTTMVNPNTGVTWGPCSGSPTDCWNSFRTAFNLQNNNLTGPAQWEQKALYFLPDCKVHKPTGNTGGENFGILARYPVLVSSIYTPPGP